MNQAGYFFKWLRIGFRKIDPEFLNINLAREQSVVLPAQRGKKINSANYE